MHDMLGWRQRFGVIGPSTNTIVQPDFDAMRPVGVTNHTSRIVTPHADAVSNESFRAKIEVIGANVLDAVRSVMTCRPDYLVMGMSAAGGQAFPRQADDRHQRRYRLACAAGQRHRHRVAGFGRLLEEF